MLIAVELLCRLQSNEDIIRLPPMLGAIDFIHEKVGVVVLEDIVFGITSNRSFNELVLQQIQRRVCHGDEMRVRSVLWRCRQTSHLIRMTISTG
jgi:hypothetical protein